MRRITLLFTHLVVITALAVGTGAHWMVLQSVAWTGMLYDYSRDASLTEAVQKTFDGRHPCNLCLTIESTEKQQHGQDAEQPVPVIRGVLDPVVTVSAPVFVFVVYPRLEEEAESFAQTPPRPPPRVA